MIAVPTTIAPPGEHLLPAVQSGNHGMDHLREFLEFLKGSGHTRGNFLGVLHILIGRRVQKTGGEEVSKGLSWRDLAGWLKKIRWAKECVEELGLDPSTLPPRDRCRFWYQAIARAGVDSSAARQAGDRLAAKLAKAGYVVSDPPG